MTSPSGTPTSTLTFDVIVVGAGLTSLVAAARYLQANPSANLTLLEHETCLGGIWNKKRTFPGLWSQTPFGVAESADLQMKKPDEEEECGSDMFRAKYITEYLEKYADSTMLPGRSLRERIKFSTSAKTLTKVDGLWQLECFASSSTDEPIRTTLFAQRIMMANGLCTVPRIPFLPGKESFSGHYSNDDCVEQAKVLVEWGVGRQLDTACGTLPRCIDEGNGAYEA
jgi:dimethylaniline monooxygenase (N-oxide forming)